MLVRDQWSRQWAHWDGATASIDQAFVLRFMGVKKTKRNDVVVVRVAHFHQPGQLERMELQLTGCELIANHTKARAGELSGLSSLRHAQKAPEGSLFQVVVSVRMTLSCSRRSACRSLRFGRALLRASQLTPCATVSRLR